MEFYVNPELMQGFGLSDTFGLAAYPNGEAQKSGFPYPRLNIARVFVRKTFGLGGEQETIEDGPNQLAGKQDISRITVAAGKDVGDRFFRQQQLLPRPAHQFHELEHVLLRLLRPDDGQGRLHLGRATRS